MDNSPPGIHDRRTSRNGPSGVRRSPSQRPERSGPQHHGHGHHHSQPYTVLVIHKDEKGYGMKVSGDNPVYVQSVKEGGAAEKAGLHSGDTIVMCPMLSEPRRAFLSHLYSTEDSPQEKICKVLRVKDSHHLKCLYLFTINALKVNGVNVLHLTHTQVVELIKVNFQIVLLGVCRAFSSESSCLRVERLKNRSVLSLSGQDSLGFLQETSTNDIKRLQEGRNGLLLMFLNARGHVLHDALAYRVGGSEVWLECDSSSLEALQTHLWMCRKNKRLQMRSLEDELSVWAVFREDGEEVGQPLPLRPELLAFRDPRLPQLGLRVLAPLGLDLGRQLARSGLSVVQAPSGLHDRLRYCLGVGEGAKEIPYGKYSPWEVNCDFLDGLSSAASQVELTVQQYPSRERPVSTVMNSPSLHRSSLHQHQYQQGSNTQARDRVTAPQPVDHEKMRQLGYQKTHTLKLMLEQEQTYVENLRSKLAKVKEPSAEAAIQRDLERAEKRVLKLQQELDLEQSEPPPLPVRNHAAQPPRPPPASPPPLPPRHIFQHSPSMDSPSQFNSLSSPHAVPQHTHQRTKSSPDNLSVNLSLAEASKRLIASESMTELSFAKRSKGGVAWEVDPAPGNTPPGTPPPPYLPGQNSPEHTYTVIPGDDPALPMPSGELLESPVKAGNFVIHNAVQVQQQIISMEDEDMSDQEMTQTEDHGPFKSLSKLWNHQAHLAVFLNYVISNSDPASLLFYLVTDLYKEGSAKEMKKWAYEIHSSFLVPGAPLRLGNVDENIAREIDDVLQKESDKEEILRRIFWKARQRSKEELNEQLADFQAKRTAGLGTLFGPRDSELDEAIHDKTKELKIIESILIPKLEPFLEDIERGVVDDRRFSTGAALGTVMGKVFGLRGPHFNSLLERCLTYVSKDKSLKTRLIGKIRKVTTKGHHFVAHQYYTVTYCNHCQLIIWGIGPQGFQCTNCLLNIHRHCVKELEESCPGPMIKKEKGNDRISKLMERIRPGENTKRKPSTLNLHHEKTKRLLEEERDSTENESGEKSGGIAGGGGAGDARLSGQDGRPSTGGGRRPDPVREASDEQGRSRPPPQDHDPPDPPPAGVRHSPDNLPHNATKAKGPGVTRSESVKVGKKKRSDLRKTSDPNLSRTNNDVEVDASPFPFRSNSDSSSNSSLSTRSLESPSASTEAVSGEKGGQAGSGSQQPWDSDIEAEPTPPPGWELRESLSEEERKRQEILNELFTTERSHLRGLKVLERVFFKPMKEKEILSNDQIQLIFANIEEMVTIHSSFNTSMKALRAEGPIIGEVGNLLLTMFDGVTGEAFQNAAAKFCAQQHLALELIKEKRRKDQKFHSFLTEAEQNSVCRRLQLKDILPFGWQRLTKYPLLLGNLLKHSSGCDSEELARLERALERSKEILNFVDTAIKEAGNQSRLAEIQRRLETAPFDRFDHPIVSEFKNLDLTRHRLLYEGPLTWRIQNRLKDLHILLLEDAIILLHKQDEKFILKFYQAWSPIIKVSTVLVRINAVDNRALFLVNTSQNGAQIYDFVAATNEDKITWFKHISDAAEAYKAKEGKNKRGGPPDHSSTEENDLSDKNKELEDGAATGGPNSPQPEPSPPQPPSSPSIPGGPTEIPATYTEEGALVDPSEVIVSQKDILTAEPVLTPLEKLRRKDELVRQALYEKQVLVADILNVPHEEFEAIADLAGEQTGVKDPSELILAAVHEAGALSRIVNEALRVSEEEVVGASIAPGHIPTVPAHKISSIVTQLNSHLSHLLDIMNERDEERERLRKELQKSREQLHAMHERHQQNGFPEKENPQTESTPPQSTETGQDMVDGSAGDTGAESSATAEASKQPPPGEVGD